MTHTATPTLRQALKGVRRVAVWTIVVSLVLTAAIGIYTIVSGELGETQGKVMLTTLAVAAFSILALCHLAVFDRDVKIVGWIGIGTSALALVLAATLIWWVHGDLGYSPGDLYMNITKAFATTTLIAVSLAHANLMLLMQNSPLRWIRITLNVALVLITIVPTLVIPVIMTDGQFPPMSFQDVYWRFFGVILILDALCTIALPVTTLVIRAQHKKDDEDETAAPIPSTGITVSLSGVNAKWVTDQATAANSTPEKIVAGLIAAARKK